MPRKCGISNVFCAEKCNVGKKVCAWGLLSAFTLVVEAVGGVSFFFIEFRKFSLKNKQQQHKPV